MATRQSKGKATVNTTAGGIVIAAANANRNGIILFNEGTVDVWVAFGETPVYQEGTKVPAGGSVVYHYAGNPNGYNALTLLECKGITNSGSALVAYQEL